MEGSKTWPRNNLRRLQGIISFPPTIILMACLRNQGHGMPSSGLWGFPCWDFRNNLAKHIIKLKTYDNKKTQTCMCSWAGVHQLEHMFQMKHFRGKARKQKKGDLGENSECAGNKQSSDGGAGDRPISSKSLINTTCYPLPCQARGTGPTTGEPL